MTTAEVRSLRQQRARLVGEMHDLTTDSGRWNAKSSNGRFEAQERWKEVNRQQEELKERIARAESDLAYEEMQRVAAPPAGQITGFPHGMPGAPRDFREAEVELPAELKPLERDLASPSYRKAWAAWAIRGMDGISSSERNLLTDLAAEARTYSGLSTGAAAGGQTLVPIGFQREIEQVMKATGGMRRNARIVPTATGNPLHWPTVDDTANNGRWIAENGPVSQTNPTFADLTLYAYLSSSDQVLVSVQLMQDSAIGVESLLAELLGKRMGRLTEAAYTVGTGTTQPTGIVTSILADTSPNTITATGSNLNDGVSTNNGTNSIGTDDLAALVAAVDPSYRPNAIIMAHYSTLDYLKKVKDKYGRPLFVPGLDAAQQDTIFGYRYDWNAAMDATVGGVPAAGKNSVLFGDFSKYVVRDVLGMTLVRFNELFMSNHQVGFQAFMRTDGLRIQSKAFSMLIQHT